MKYSKARTGNDQGLMKYLFLESHGLRSPLTAIRWACGRLRKESSGSLNPEQQRLVQHIYSNTRILTAALESMLLLAKLEDQGIPYREQEVCSQDIIDAALEKVGRSNGIRWVINAVHAHFSTDREFLEVILKDILTVFSESSDRTDRVVFLDAEQAEDGILFSFRSALLLPSLQGDLQETGHATKIIGGIPGLMLSLANELAKHLKGNVEMEDVITGEFISDGTVELEERADEQRLILFLPTRSRIVHGPCSTRKRAS
jgi:signal transduction histidine kinase